MRNLILLCLLLVGSLNSLAQVTRVAILDFDNISGIAKYDGLGKAMSSMLISDIEANVSPKRLQLVERAQIQKVLKEQNFQASGNVNKSTAVEAGKILGVNYLLVGDVYILNDQLIINARLTNTETGDIVFSKKQEGKTVAWLTLKTNIAKDLATSLSQPFTEPTIPDKEINVATITTFGNAVAAKDTGNVQLAETLSSTVIDYNPEFKYIDDLKKEIDELKKQVAKNTADIEVLNKSGDLVLNAATLEEFENNLKSDLLSNEKKFDVFMGMIKKHSDLIVDNPPKYGQFGYEINFDKVIDFKHLDFIEKQLDEVEKLSSTNQKIMLLRLVRGELSLLLTKCANPKAYYIDLEIGKLCQSIILFKKCLFKLQPLKHPNISIEELLFNEIIVPYSSYDFFNIDSNEINSIKYQIYSELILKLNSKYYLEKRISDALLAYSRDGVNEKKFFYLILFIHFNELKKINKEHEIFKLNSITDLWSKRNIFEQIERDNFELALVIDANGVIFNDNLNKSEIIVGIQTWMTKNLNVDHFQNGDYISQAKTFEEWKKFLEIGEAAWCYYDFDENNSQECGKIYNWFAVIDKRLLAPKGWHIPSSSEWELLMTQIGGCFSEMTDSIYSCAGKVKMTTGWEKSTFHPATNETGFSALPCGRLHNDYGTYNFEEAHNEMKSSWWSSTWIEPTSTGYQKYNIASNNQIIEEKYNIMVNSISTKIGISSAAITELANSLRIERDQITVGMFVRCVKDSKE